MWKAGGKGQTAGFTYLAVLILLFAVALAAQTTFAPPQNARTHDNEAELLFRGKAYQAALASFWESGDLDRVMPLALSDLVSDPRQEGRRHIRRLYLDPMTGTPFQLLRDDAGRIIGVASKSTQQPRRTAFLDEAYSQFSGARTYADWRFTFSP